MVDNLEKEFEVKSRLLNELQQILDAKIEVISQLEKKLDDKTITLEQFKEQIKINSNEILQQKLELDTMRNLLSYKIGKSYGDKFGNAPGSKLFEKMISYFFKQNYDDLSNSKEIQSQEILESKEPHAEIISESTDHSESTSTSESTDPSESTDTSESTEPTPEENLYEFLKPKLTPTQKTELIKNLQQKLTTTKFNHNESLTLNPSLMELCFESKSNMLDEWELACLCSCIKNFDWKKDDYLIEIGTNIGQTAVLMAKVFQDMELDTKIISVDPFSFATDEIFNPKGNYTYYVTLTKQQQVNDICIPVTAYSQNISNIFKENVGVLLVDGSHQYEDVKKDLDYYSKLVKLNGYVFVDDYSASGYPGVYRAFEEWLVSHDNFELSYKDSYFVIAKKVAN